MRLKHVLDARSLSEIHETRSGLSQASRDHRDQVSSFYSFHTGPTYWDPASVGSRLSYDKQGRWRLSGACGQSATPRTHSALSTRIVHEDSNYHIGSVSWPRRGVFLSSPEINHIAVVLQRYDPAPALHLCLQVHKSAWKDSCMTFRLHLIYWRLLLALRSTLSLRGTK